MKYLFTGLVAAGLIGSSMLVSAPAEAVSFQLIGSTTTRGVPGNFNPQHNPSANQSNAIPAINEFLGGGDATGQDIFSETLNVFEAVNNGSGFTNDKTAQEGLRLVGLDAGIESVTIRFTFFGSEAGFVNLALARENGLDTTLFTDTATVGATREVTFTTAELLTTNNLIPFAFETSDGNPDRQARNAGTIDGALELGFSRLIDNVSNFASGSTIAFFGDGGAGPDGDLDDLVLGIGITSVSTVPVPPALPLLVTGLLALGWLRRR